MERAETQAAERLRTKLADPHWRLESLYHVEAKSGEIVPFRVNAAQTALLRELHYCNVILKARQLGFSTLILMLMLDVCLFNSNKRCGIVDATVIDAKRKLDKARLAYDLLPDWVKAARPIKSASAFKIEWQNGSSIEVGTSHRGGTLQYLHISELGKIAAKHPEKAREIRTGALNTIQAGQFVFIESTAEGQDGDFYDTCQRAEAKVRLQTKLGPLDFRFHFFPWWQAREYELDPAFVTFTVEHQRYFDALAAKHQIVLSERQKAWYVSKLEMQQEDMKREYPSTPSEAFEASVEGAIFGSQMEAAEREGRIGKFPAHPHVPVHTFWDIGRRDYTSIWFVQVFAGKLRVVGYYQNCMLEMPHYAEYCFGTDHAKVKFPHLFGAATRNIKGIFAGKGWQAGDDVFPHDGKQVEWGSGRGRMEQILAAGFNGRIGSTLSLHDGINAARATIPLCEFDAEGCGEGLRMLKTYRWEWDDIRGAWRTGVPRHDLASHGSDAFRTLATSWREVRVMLEPKPRTHLFAQRDPLALPMSPENCRRVMTAKLIAGGMTSDAATAEAEQARQTIPRTMTTAELIVYLRSRRRWR